MTDRRRPAAAARILATGISVAVALGVAGELGARASGPAPAAGPAVTPTPPQQLVIKVVRRRRPARGVASPPNHAPAPAPRRVIVRRVVRAAPAKTTTHGS